MHQQTPGFLLDLLAAKNYGLLPQRKLVFQQFSALIISSPRHLASDSL